jgi:predicted nucleic acid-binding protein
MDAPFMGLIVDTSSLITAERRKQSAVQIFSQLRLLYGDVSIGISVVTILELAHGIERAKTPDQRDRRTAFLEDLTADLKVYPVTVDIARVAGSISGRLASHGVNIAFEDLLIGCTALYHQFQIVTENVKHFQLIPGLVVGKLT